MAETPDSESSGVPEADARAPSSNAEGTDVETSGEQDPTAKSREELADLQADIEDGSADENAEGSDEDNESGEDAEGQQSSEEVTEYTAQELEKLKSIVQNTEVFAWERLSAIWELFNSGGENMWSLALSFVDVVSNGDWWNPQKMTAEEALAQAGQQSTEAGSDSDEDDETDTDQVDGDTDTDLDDVDLSGREMCPENLNKHVVSKSLSIATKHGSKPRLTSVEGDRLLSGSKEVRRHHGNDYDAEMGDPIVANVRLEYLNCNPATGEMRLRPVAGGDIIEFHHAEFGVPSAGYVFEPGEVIARVSNKGHVVAGPGGDGSHLHLEGDAIDPSYAEAEAKLRKDEDEEIAAFRAAQKSSREANS